MPTISETTKKLIEKNDPTIQHLDLSNRGFNDDDISDLQELLQNNNYINSLNLSNNNITTMGCQSLSLISSLKTVDLSRCSVGDEGIAALVNTKIESLDVSNCGITEKGARLLQQHVNRYKTLTLSGNLAISAETLEQIRAKFVENPSVSTSPIGIDLGLNIHSSSEQVF